MRPHVHLGHGASGSAETMAPFVEGLRARGFEATALAAFHRQVPSEPGIAVGGHSFGGRVASLAAAEAGSEYEALILFSYPLHRPGGPDGETRVAHWPAIRCPVLLLSGESDPFARIDLLRAAVGRLARAELVTYPRLGHTLRPVLDDALDRVARFLAGLDGGGDRGRLPG